jgi:hypothetical protein
VSGSGQNLEVPHAPRPRPPRRCFADDAEHAAASGGHGQSSQRLSP